MRKDGRNAVKDFVRRITGTLPAGNRSVTMRPQMGTILNVLYKCFFFLNGEVR